MRKTIKYGIADEGKAEEFHRAVNVERRLTARWYLKISGVEAWSDGEKERLTETMEHQAMIVNSLRPVGDC